MNINLTMRIVIDQSRRAHRSEVVRVNAPVRDPIVRNIITTTTTIIANVFIPNHLVLRQHGLTKIPSEWSQPVHEVTCATHLRWSSLLFVAAVDFVLIPVFFVLM